MAYRRVAQLRTADDLRAYLREINVALPFDEAMQHGSDAPLAQPYTVHGRTVGNRFAVLPMEGWDGTNSGGVTEEMLRRWSRFGESGAELIYGGEGMAVRPDGRANPNQLIIHQENIADIARLREALQRSLMTECD